MSEAAARKAWLEFFMENADFGPAHEDVVHYMRMAFIEQHPEYMTDKERRRANGEDEDEEE